MIIGIAGAAGSGKDTVAGFISKYTKAQPIAQADPMKRFAKDVFGFTEEQLWGPSECRNAPDERYTVGINWIHANNQLINRGMDWIKEVLPNGDHSAAFGALADWFHTMWRAHKTDEGVKALTPRYMLQTIGTEWGRQFSGDMWNDCAKRAARKLLAGGHGYSRTSGLYTMTTPSAEPEFVLITDVRFKNEVVGIREVGGIVINITSPAEDNAAVEKAGVAGHKSEAELKEVPKHWYRYSLVNDKRLGLLALENKVHGLVQKLVAHEVL